MLFSARQGNEPFGVIVLAERLNVKTPHSNGIKDGADFIDRVERFNPEQHAVVQSRKHFVSMDGLPIDQLIYTTNGEHTSAIAVQIKDFLIAFRCNAKSENDLAKMNRSVVELHLIK
jgi:hypothetical protein